MKDGESVNDFAMKLIEIVNGIRVLSDKVEKSMHCQEIFTGHSAKIFVDRDLDR